MGSLVELDDEILVCRCAQGDEQAFVELVRRYEQLLATLIRYQIDNLDHAEDVLQETLLHAWIGLRRLREPKKVGAWLLQIARNQCRDFHKSSQRRDLPTEDQDLKQIVNRFGLALVPQRETVDNVLEALEEVPAAEREVAKWFYLEGLTIAEIAARNRCPEGTVKRRLFYARDYVRQTFGIIPNERRSEMTVHKKGAKKQPFPLHRPEIVIKKLQTKPFSVDCPELRWWCIIPKVGERALFAMYHPPQWKLTDIYEMQAVRPAKIHDIDGVEIDISEWKPETGWTPSAWTMYGRLTEEKAQYLAKLFVHDGKRIMWTFLDEGFNDDWGESPRRVENRDCFVLQKDGSFKQVYTPRELEAIGAGVFSVKIGERSFTCLRVYDLKGSVKDKASRGGELTEGYVTQAGRTVLVRQHCPPGFPFDRFENKIADEKTQIVIDGVTFVHWYDSLSNLAFGF